MSLDWITEPVSDDSPGGPDLDLADDEHFIDYYYDAVGRLPERYVRMDRPNDPLFDPESVSLKDELENIDELLGKSRDLRLLNLRFQWQALAHDIAGMAETLTATADTLEALGSDMVPDPREDAQMRRDAINDFGAMATVQFPLQYFDMTGGAGATIRAFDIATGASEARDDEEPSDNGTLMSNLALSSFAKRVDAAHVGTMALASAYERISAACSGSADAPFTPSFKPVLELVNRMRGLILEARPDRRDEDPDFGGAAPQVGEDGEAADPDEGGETPEGGAGPQMVAVADPGEVRSHPQARGILEAVERFFRTREPSSPSLLLVTQARLLIGLTLPEAMRILMPSKADYAEIVFAQQFEFKISSSQLDNLAYESSSSGTPDDAYEDFEIPEIETHADINAQLGAVEAYFKVREKSSPIPILLRRARTYLGKEFTDLLGEFVSTDE